MIATFFFVTCLADCSVTAQPDTRKYEITVPRDTESRVLSLRNYSRPLANRGSESAGLPDNRLYCRPEDLPKVPILMQPSHGTVRLGKGRSKLPDCPDLLPAIVVFYKPAAGFSGRDDLIVEQEGDYWTNGNDRQAVIAITVQ